MSNTPEQHTIPPNIYAPNNSLPILIYRSVLPNPLNEDTTTTFLEKDGTGAWRKLGSSPNLLCPLPQPAPESLQHPLLSHSSHPHTTDITRVTLKRHMGSHRLPPLPPERARMLRHLRGPLAPATRARRKRCHRRHASRRESRRRDCAACRDRARVSREFRRLSIYRGLSEGGSQQTLLINRLIHPLAPNNGNDDN